MAKVSKKAKGEQFLSDDPDDAEQAGLLDKAKVETTYAKYERRSTSNYSEDPDDPDDPSSTTPCLHMKVRPIIKGAKEEQEEVDVYWSCGSLARVVPSKDGNRILPAEGSTARGLASGCNAHIFLKSLKDAGLDWTHIKEDGVEALVGLIWQLERVPQPGRAGLAEPEEGEQKRARTVPVCTEIHETPWDEEGGKAKTKKKTAKKDEEDEEEEEEDQEEEEQEEEDEEETEEEDSEEDDDEEEDEDGGDDELTEDAQAVVVSLLEKNPKGIPAAKLAPMAFKALEKNPKRKKLIDVMGAKNFVKAGAKADLWAFDGKTITAAEE